MEERTSDRQREHKQALDEMYRQGYHHGLARQREVLLHLLADGIPPLVALELCRVFEEEIIVPWRTNPDAGSVPPSFDVQECQRLLRGEKERRSKKS